MTEKTLWDLEALIKTDNKQLGFVIARKVDQSQGLPETDAKDRLGLGAEAPTYKPQLTSTTSKSQQLHRQIPKTPSPWKNDSAEGMEDFSFETPRRPTLVAIECRKGKYWSLRISFGTLSTNRQKAERFTDRP